MEIKTNIGSGGPICSGGQLSCGIDAGPPRPARGVRLYAAQPNGPLASRPGVSLVARLLATIERQSEAGAWSQTSKTMQNDLLLLLLCRFYESRETSSRVKLGSAGHSNQATSLHLLNPHSKLSKLSRIRV